MSYILCTVEIIFYLVCSNVSRVKFMCISSRPHGAKFPIIFYNMQTELQNIAENCVGSGVLMRGMTGVVLCYFCSDFVVFRYA